MNRHASPVPGIRKPTDWWHWVKKAVLGPYPAISLVMRSILLHLKRRNKDTFCRRRDAQMEVDSGVLTSKLVLHNLVPRCVFPEPLLSWGEFAIVCQWVIRRLLKSGEKAKLQLGTVWVTDRQWKSPRGCMQSCCASWGKLITLLSLLAMAPKYSRSACLPPHRMQPGEQVSHSEW